MQSPYEDLPPRAFWRTGVVGQPPEAIPDIYRRKFKIGVETHVAAAGSCFAQHIARHMRARGFTVLDEEPPPYGLAPEKMAQFGFGIYSARYGNIYTARQLRQLAEEAFGTFEPADAVWEKDGRYYDALRPSVEPNGLCSPEAVADQREWHLAKVRRLVRKADLFVFTLGLTETWIHSDSGTVYPSAPGVIAGEYDPQRHTFKNFGFHEVYDDVRAFFELAKSHNPGLRLLLTVSPVPLTATASGEHVLYATIYSKSVLRAVAGQLCQENPDIDYFPSYEIVTSPLAKSGFFENNLRSVRNDAVESVMRIFFAAHSGSAETSEPARPKAAAPPLSTGDDEVVCEEVLLDAFAG
jgi:hypothetical protein